MNKGKIKNYLLDHKLAYFLLFPIILSRRFFLSFRRKSSIRIFDKFLSRIVEGTVFLNIPEYSGMFTIDIRSHIFRRIALFNEYETGIRDLVLTHLDRSRDAIDVGANIGLFTVLMAKQLSSGRRVLAIEPTSGASTLLRKNLLVNDVSSSVELYQGAAGNENMKVDICIPQGREEYASIGRELVHESIAGYPIVKEQVKCNTLDYLVAKHDLVPGLIKIDVEGAEYFVLDGAKETLKRFRPVVIFESSQALMKNFPYTFSDIEELFITNHYSVYSLWETDEFLAIPIIDQ